MRNSGSVPSDPVEANALLHNFVAPIYEFRHREIFNRIEQARLTSELTWGFRVRSTTNPRALDFGAGTGNLTEKLLRLDAHVCAVDVAPGMLKGVEERHVEAWREGRLRTYLLDGKSALPFPNEHFGFVAAYSVLHHVPDYLAAVRDLIRVLAPGGVLYLDHELSEAYWLPSLRQRTHRLIMMPRYSLGRVWARVQRLWGVQEPRLPPPGQRAVSEEGDVHIYADDHVEWSAIRRLASEAGLEPLAAKHYLLCRETSRFPLRYLLCRPFMTDMSLYVGRKPATRSQ